MNIFQRLSNNFIYDILIPFLTIKDICILDSVDNHLLIKSEKICYKIPCAIHIIYKRPLVTNESFVKINFKFIELKKSDNIDKYLKCYYFDNNNSDSDSLDIKLTSKLHTSESQDIYYINETKKELTLEYKNIYINIEKIKIDFPICFCKYMIYELFKISQDEYYKKYYKGSEYYNDFSGYILYLHCNQNSIESDFAIMVNVFYNLIDFYGQYKMQLSQSEITNYWKDIMDILERKEIDIHQILYQRSFIHYDNNHFINSLMWAYKKLSKEHNEKVRLHKKYWYEYHDYNIFGDNNE